jgi:hypothetical protein
VRRAAWLLLLLVVPPLAAQDHGVPGANLQVFLLTMGPGEHIDARFGHNAIWIHDNATGQDLVYNYGTFDPGAGAAAALKFIGRFAMGRPRYWLGVLDMQATLAVYSYWQRNLEQQELDLLPAQRADLAQRLATNALEANRYYRYDYYRDNCSTRVRDILDAVLAGALRRATVGRPAEGTLRFHSLRSVTNSKLLFLGIDAGLGTPVDGALDQWDEMFLPEKVQERVREIRLPGADGREVPLVKAEGRMLEFNRFHVDAAPPDWSALWLGAGALLALLIATGRLPGRLGVPGRLVATAWALVIGLGGLMLCFLWFVSSHVATMWNLNLLYCSPVALVLLSGIWGSPSHRPHRLVGWAAGLLLLSVGIGLVLTLVGTQQNQVIAELSALPSMILGASVLAPFIRQRDGVLPPPR